MSYLDLLRTLNEDGDFSEKPKSATDKTDRTLSKGSFVSSVSSSPGPFQENGPPPLTDDEQADIREAFDERAAIMEFDGGLPRPEAEAQAARIMRVYRVRVAMGEGELDRWAVMLAPGCDLPEARRAADHQFGPERVLELREVKR